MYVCAANFTELPLYVCFVQDLKYVCMYVLVSVPILYVPFLPIMYVYICVCMYVYVSC